MKTIFHQGLTYRIGENREDNDQLVKTSDKSWWWFHLKHQPSCHVVLENDLKDLDKQDQRKAIKQGCVLCKQSSRVVQHIPVDIIWTQLEHVNPTHIPGSVNVQKSKTIRV